jgi:Predicted hydrolases of the HAD superfamily
VLSSGRSYDGIAYAYKELGISGSDEYMINCGGNLIESLDKEIIYEKVLDNSVCEKVARELNANKLNYILIDEEGNSYDSYQEWMEQHMLNNELGIVKFMVHTHNVNCWRRQSYSIKNLIRNSLSL